MNTDFYSSAFSATVRLQGAGGVCCNPGMASEKFVAGFSGHRKLRDWEVVSRSIARVWRILNQEIQRKGRRLELLAGAAYGSDLLAIEVARREEIPVHIVLPKPVLIVGKDEVDLRSGLAADFWRPEQGDGEPVFLEEEWNRAFRAIREAQAGINGGTVRLPSNCGPAPQCYYQSGLEVVKGCDLFAAVWDGQLAKGPGGTAEMVNLARTMGKATIIIEAETGVVASENLGNCGLAGLSFCEAHD